MKDNKAIRLGIIGGGLCLGMLALSIAYSQEANQKPSSYMPVDIKESFATIMARMTAAKPEVMKRQMDLLNVRYDLANHPAKDVTMSRGKPVQEGVRAKLPQGMTWEKLQAMSPEEVRGKDVFPAGFLPLPHPNHPEGGMVFPKFHINEIQKQEGRDLTRFDLDFDLPDHFFHLPARAHQPTQRQVLPGTASYLGCLDRPAERVDEVIAVDRLLDEVVSSAA